MPPMRGAGPTEARHKVPREEVLVVFWVFVDLHVIPRASMALQNFKYDKEYKLK